MRKKYISKTYMREVIDWDIVISKKEDKDHYIVVKRINKTTVPFVLHEFDKDTIHIDNGYYIVEFTPLYRNYNARVYLDSNKNIIDYYFDISRGNGVDDNMPYYDDLYLDVIYYPNENDLIKIIDDDELSLALEKGNITKEEYDLAISESTRLVEEIENKTNEFITMDFKNIVEEYFE